MQKSKIVEIDGIFVGAAVFLSETEGWRFVAADQRAHDADGRIAPTLHEAQQLAKKAFFSARSPISAIPGAPTAAWPVAAGAQLRASA